MCYLEITNDFCLFSQSQWMLLSLVSLFFINKATPVRMYAQVQIHSLTVFMNELPHTPEEVQGTGSKHTLIWRGSLPGFKKHQPALWFIERSWNKTILDKYLYQHEYIVHNYGVKPNSKYTLWLGKLCTHTNWNIIISLMSYSLNAWVFSSFITKTFNKMNIRTPILMRVKESSEIDQD